MFAVVEEEIAPTPVEEVVESAPSNLVEVFENRIIFENKKSKTSMSVWQVQRRLNDLGYEIVRQAKPGYYEALTLNAVKAYRADKNLGEGEIDAKFLKSLFAGDKAVKLILA
jgi:peptidoglycan hydrolase-like protein with peptidoglycan-binding domain